MIQGSVHAGPDTDASSIDAETRCGESIVIGPAIDALMVVGPVVNASIMVGPVVDELRSLVRLMIRWWWLMSCVDGCRK